MGLAYLGMSSAQGAPLLTDHDVSSGLAAPLVAQKLLGTTGEYAILFLILMAVMSTGSAEVIAVASIIIYDIYQVKLTSFARFVRRSKMRQNFSDGHKHFVLLSRAYCISPAFLKLQNYPFFDLGTTTTLYKRTAFLCLCRHTSFLSGRI